MTISEKSTELGIDLAQIALDSYGVSKCKVNGSFHCFTLTGGEAQNIYIFDDNGVKVHEGYFRWSNDELAEGSDLATVGSALKTFIDSQEFNPTNTDEVTFEPLT